MDSNTNSVFAAIHRRSGGRRGIFVPIRAICQDTMLPRREVRSAAIDLKRMGLLEGSDSQEEYGLSGEGAAAVARGD